MTSTTRTFFCTVRRMATRRIAATALGIAAILGTPALVPAVSAETLPDAPRPSDSCTASLTLVPSVTVFNGDEPVELRISGLEPFAEYRIFAGSRRVGDGIASADGTATNSFLPNALVAVVIPVQVASAGRCAQATLTVVGPVAVRCQPIQVSDFLVICSPEPR